MTEPPAPITHTHKTSLTKTNSSTSKRKLLPHHKLELKRALAEEIISRSELARRYNISTPYVTQFANRYASEIEDIRQHLTDQWAGLWVADKKNRLSAYMDEIERLNESKYADHHEWSKARQQALRSVAEELGDLPPRQTTFVQTVVHVVEGVNIEEYLK
jgi:hypothetical protein